MFFKACGPLDSFSLLLKKLIKYRTAHFLILNKIISRLIEKQSFTSFSFDIQEEKAFKKTNSFYFPEIKSRFKAFLQPTTVLLLWREVTAVPGPGKNFNMCWQSCKLNSESLRFNTGIFIKSKSCLKLFIGVYTKILALFSRVSFLDFIPDV